MSKRIAVWVLENNYYALPYPKITSSQENRKITRFVDICVFEKNLLGFLVL
jgi:hypothetical protein